MSYPLTRGRLCQLLDCHPPSTINSSHIHLVISTTFPVIDPASRRHITHHSHTHSRTTAFPFSTTQHCIAREGTAKTVCPGRFCFHLLAGGGLAPVDITPAPIIPHCSPTKPKRHASLRTRRVRKLGGSVLSPVFRTPCIGTPPPRVIWLCFLLSLFLCVCLVAAASRMDIACTH